MGNIKCKIIGNQVWTVDNLTKEQYYMITRRSIPVKNNNWSGYNGPKCYTYEANYRNKKKQYLFDIRSVEYFRGFSEENNNWRIPSFRDLNILFSSINKTLSTDYMNDEIAKTLRGTYGWINNGTNKIGFNALPNPTLNENCELTEPEVSMWWLYNETSNEFNGFGLYQEDIVAFCGTSDNNGLAIRLVMDLENPRVEHNIVYI